MEFDIMMKDDTPLQQGGGVLDGKTSASPNGAHTTRIYIDLSAFLVLSARPLKQNKKQCV